MRKNKHFYIKLWSLAFLIIASIWIIRNNKESVPFQKNEGTVFGTIYHASYQYPSSLQKEIAEELQKVDNSLSPFNDKSIITKINLGYDVEADSMFIYVYNLSNRISEATNGAFDITVAPLVNAWGFGFKHKEDITKPKIDSIRTFVGYKKTSLKGKHIVKEDARTMLDCSAIAKGYGSDVIAQLFDRKGIKNYMIEIGGEIVVKGNNAEGEIWNIGVIKPTNDSTNAREELQTVINISNTAMATSGNYRNFYYKDGKKFAHTIDPSTGYPVQHSILSSTVFAPNCATADAYATSFMVMGLEKAKALLSKNKELKAYFIYSDKKGEIKTWYTPNMAEYMKQ